MHWSLQGWTTCNVLDVGLPLGLVQKLQLVPDCWWGHLAKNMGYLCLAAYLLPSQISLQSPELRSRLPYIYPSSIRDHQQVHHWPFPKLVRLICKEETAFNFISLVLWDTHQ